MPQIHPNHIKGNLAVKALATKFAAAGILSEELSNDYGEDLLLQTHLGSIADSFAIRVQVKYIRAKKTKNEKYAFRFPVSHLWRWVSHADPVFLCFYDGSSQNCWLVDPKTRFSLWKLSTTKQKSLAVYFSEHDLATSTKIGELIWLARVAYYSANIARLENYFQYAPVDAKDKKSREFILLELGVVLFAFLRSIKVVSTRGIDEKFVSYVSNAAFNLAKHKDLNLRAAFMLALLGRADDLVKGLPRNILEQATELCGHYFRYSKPKEWRRLSGLYRAKWYPFGIKKKL